MWLPMALPAYRTMCSPAAAFMGSAVNDLSKLSVLGFGADMVLREKHFSPLAPSATAPKNSSS